MTTNEQDFANLPRVKAQRQFGERFDRKRARGEKDILTTAEAAALLGLGSRTIEKLAFCGDIPSVKIARRWRFSRRAIERWLEYSALKRTDAGFQYFYRNVSFAPTDAGIKSCLRSNYEELGARAAASGHPPDETNEEKRFRERLEREARKREEKWKAKEEAKAEKEEGAKKGEAANDHAA